MSAGRIPTAILISGQGSNMQALIAAARGEGYPARIALVVSNRPQAAGLKAARAAGVETLIIDHTPHATREAFEAALDAALRARGIELVCLAGFMRILSPWFVERWQRRLMNIHPSLLPAYKGLDTHARVLAAGETQHGATVHWVTAELDAGEVIAQEAIDVQSGETAEQLQARVREVEHRLYPEALKEIGKRLRDN